MKMLISINVVGYQLIFFSIAWKFQFDKLYFPLARTSKTDNVSTDFAGGTNFIILSIVTLSMGITDNVHARNLVPSLLVIVWAIRLSGFLLFRIIMTDKDDRFDSMRHRFFKFLGFWILQMAVNLPVTILNSPMVSYSMHASQSSGFNAATDIIGVIFFAAGISIEAIADIQKVNLSYIDNFWSIHSINFGGTTKILIFSWIKVCGHGLDIPTTLVTYCSGLEFGWSAYLQQFKGSSSALLLKRYTLVLSALSSLPVPFPVWYTFAYTWSIDVCLWSFPPGSRQCKETISKISELGSIQRASKSNKYTIPYSTLNLYIDTDIPQTYVIPRSPDICILSWEGWRWGKKEEPWEELGECH